MGAQLVRSRMNMIMFRGKFTVSPNTLNNEIHTYFFADYWQQKYKESEFKRKAQIAKVQLDKLQKAEKIEPIDPAEEKEQKDNSDYSYKKWMKLIKDVSEFNRFYVDCYKEAFPQEGKNLNIMDFRAFRLFHDWDVWGDSTSYAELKATAVYDSSKLNPISSLNDDVHLSTKMGTNKCVMANMDTDSQDMSKLFAFTLNLGQQLKLHLNPSVARTLYFRTVDSLPWTPSMGVHWFASGETELLHGNINQTTVKWPLSILYNKYVKKNLTQLRMLQYRYNHPSKVSSVVGYLMNTEASNDNDYEYINHNWRIVKITSKYYDNPNPARNYNGNFNTSTTAQVFVRNVKYGWVLDGVLVDVSAAVMDANCDRLLPYFPHSLHIRILNGQTNALIGQFKSTNQNQIQNIFHNKSGLLLIKNARLPDNIPIKIQLFEIVKSTILGKDKQVNINVDFNGVEETYNLEIKDHFLKTKPADLLLKDNGGLDDTEKIYPIYENFVKYELHCTQFGTKVNGKFSLALNSNFNIDRSGLSQYTKNKEYLETLRKPNPGLTDPTTIIEPPKQRIQKLINASKRFRDTFNTYDDVSHLVFQDKLDQIISETDKYVGHLFNGKQLQYTYGERVPFKLSFKPNELSLQTYVEFKDGIGSVSVYLNKDLLEQINPRHPAMESLCMTGQIKIGSEPIPDDGINPNITALFFHNPKVNPYLKIDWLNVVGPKLRLMGLMYPSMQNIVNLYDYDGLSMSAMRRAFEIQDERHSRYMPATRQMSSSTHRQIRRWLYNPIYDYKIHLEGLYIPSKDEFAIDFKDFTDGKNQLIELLNNAFKLELTTIPLYLSAMYSISREGEATSLFRSVAKDEMKHLFIVSNILNALGASPPYPKPHEGHVDSVPTFPIQTQTKLICFHFQLQENNEWKDLMNPLPIQSSILEQLLRFIMIEMPGEAYEIKIQPLLVDPVTKKYVQLKPPTCNCKKLICHCPRNILQQRTYRINLLREAIDAVVKEMAAKPTLPKGGDEFMTIGMAYEKITNYLWALNDMNSVELFNGDNAKQFTYMYLDSMTEVINLRTALEQVRLITEEGEGSSMFTVTGETNKSSHFIKFIEIFLGCDLKIVSRYSEQKSITAKDFKRQAWFVFTPNEERFPNFPNYTNVEWSQAVDKQVDKQVNYELGLQRFSDNLRFTKFPNTYAPRSFLNNYMKILEEMGFIFTTNPKDFKSSDGLTFEETRLRSLENSIARMRQMTLNATHVVHPNDTFDRKFPHLPNEKRPNYPPLTNTPPPKVYPSASPNYNRQNSSWLPDPKDKK